MSTEKPLFSVSPLVYDALSGEFIPSADGRKHTLGRLMAATVLKGEYEFMEFKEWANNYGLYTYRPSWAPDTVSRVESWAIGENHVVMSSLHLKRADNSRSLSIVSPLGQYPLSLALWHDTANAIFDLELGDKLHIARESVATAAQAYFSEDQ